MKPVTCGSEPDRSTVTSLPCLVTRARIDDVGACRSRRRPAPPRRRRRRPPRRRRWRARGARRRPASLPPHAASVARAELGDDRGQPLLAQPRRADLRRQVAAEIARMADVQRQHLQQVLAQHAVLGQAHRRHAQALVPDFGGGGVVGAVRGAADIGMMRAHHRPEHQRRPGEHRHEGGQVGQMRAAAIRVVQQVDVVAARGRETARPAPWPPRAWRRHAPGYGPPAPPGGSARRSARWRSRATS